MYLRLLVDDFVIGFNELSDETIYFEIFIDNIYKTSEIDES